MITYRPYATDDWDAICRVHDRSRPDELRGSCDARAFIPLAEDPESEEIPDYTIVVACDPDVVAFTGVRGSYIGWLYVDPDYYGQGVGRALLRKAIEMAGPDARTVALKGNQRALNLYESEGFRVVKEVAGKCKGYPCTGLHLSRPG